MEVLPFQDNSQERCTPCRAFTLFSLAGGNEYKHHPSLASLKVSALNGCDFCKLLWHCFITSTSEDALATAMKGENQQIIIRPNSVNMKTKPALDKHAAFDELWVDVGEDLEHKIFTTVELFTSRRKKSSILEI